LFTACAPLRHAPVEPAQSVAEELFDRGIAELAASGETTFFQTLIREYPASAWASRARSVSTLVEGRAEAAAEDLDRRKRRTARAEAEGARLRPEVERLTAAVAQLEKERDRLAVAGKTRSAELERLRADNARLLGDLEQLKNLTIEMELKR
jgi:hypothetical protein